MRAFEGAHGRPRVVRPGRPAQRFQAQVRHTAHRASAAQTRGLPRRASSVRPPDPGPARPSVELKDLRHGSDRLGSELESGRPRVCALRCTPRASPARLSQASTFLATLPDCR